MNKQRRKELSTLADELQACLTRLENLRDDEREAFDNMTEGLQETERGQAIEAAADALETAADDLETAINAINEAMEG